MQSIASQRYRIVEEQTLRKLEESKAAAESQTIRSIRCPQCGDYLLDVYGHGHYLIRLKCRKCKFCETIDTALFRTVHGRVYRGKRSSRMGYGREVWIDHTRIPF